MEQGDGSVGGGSEIFEGGGWRHGTAEDGVDGVDTGDFVGVGDRPGVDVAGGVGGAFEGGVFGKVVVGEMFVEGIPVCKFWAVGVEGDGAGDDVESFFQQL